MIAREKLEAFASVLITLLPLPAGIYLLLFPVSLAVGGFNTTSLAVIFIAFPCVFWGILFYLSIFKGDHKK